MSQGRTPRNIVVVGATGTLGSAVARLAVARGDRVTLVARDRGRLARLVSELGMDDGEGAPRAKDASLLTLDVAAPSGASDLARAVPDATDLIVAMGSFPHTPLDEVTREAFAAQVVEHCALFVELVRALAPAIDRAGGGAVGFGDDGVERPYPNHIAYLAAKGALVAAARALSLELSGREGRPLVRVGIVAVGVVTDPELDDPVRGEALARRARVGRTGRPAEVAHAALALIDATWSSGEVWGVGR